MTVPARFQVYRNGSLLATGAVFPRAAHVTIVGTDDDWTVTAPTVGAAVDQTDGDHVEWLDDRPVEG